MATNAPIANGLLDALRQNAGWAVGVGIVLMDLARELGWVR